MSNRQRTQSPSRTQDSEGGSAVGRRLQGGIPTAREQNAARVFVVGFRPLRVGEDILQPGEVVPGAGEWTNVESWIRARSIVPQDEYEARQAAILAAQQPEETVDE